MEVGHDADAVRPGVGREHEAGGLGHAGDGLGAGDAAREGGIGLVDVQAAVAEVFAELMDAEVEFAAGDARGGAPPQFGEAVVVVVPERLLQPVDVILLHGDGHLDGGADVPARGEVGGVAPAVVGIDHDAHAVADGLADGFERRQVVDGVWAVEA